MFNIERLIYNELTFDLSKFIMNIFLSVIVNSEFSVCPGLGIDNDIIEFVLTTSLKFSDCYKEVLRDLCDFSSTWIGYEAKILDDCSKSTDTNIRLSKMKLYDPHTDYTLLGTVHPTSLKYCYSLPGIGLKPDCQANGAL